jgi:polysaccharide biosynthesis transport protein
VHTASKRIRRNETYPGGVAPVASGTTAMTPYDAQFDVWRVSQRALRGRYRLALMLAAGGGIAGAVGGVLYGQRLYRATGLVRIASSLPTVLRETDQNRPIALLDGFMQAQRDVMTSREMIQTAMRDPAWQQTNFGGSGFSDERFAANLKVETRPRSDYLKVTFTDVESTTAAAAVQAIINSFQRDYAQEQDRVEGQRISELTSRRDGFMAELKKLEADIAPIALGRDAADLEPLYLAVGDRVKKLRSALADAQCAMAGMTDELQRQPVATRSPAEVAAEDVLRVQSAELARLEGQIEDGQGRFGPAHPLMIRLEAAAKSAKARVARANEICQAARAERSQGPSALSLSEREANLRRLTLAAEEELARLSSRRTLVKAFDERSAIIRQDLAETNRRLDALATEASQGSRLTVITNGEKPLTALLDSRPKFAAAGAMAGAGFPLACLVMSASLRRRYRYCDEVSEDLLQHVPFVAVIPQITCGVKEEPAMNIEAARSIHQMRVRLQPPSAKEPRTYLITSTAGGEGKSSTSVALALSFAAAGFRTLLVDCDLKSRHLTHWFHADNAKGAIEAMTGETPPIRQTKSGLHVLPTGQSRMSDTFSLAPTAVSVLLASVRDQYDVILFDAEPILTGVVATSIARQVDGVIVAFARGQEPAQVDRTLRYIDLLGADLSCAVFNRAAPSEFREALREAAALPANERPLLPASWSRFGAITAAVMWSLTLFDPDQLSLLPIDAMPAEKARAAA